MERIITKLHDTKVLLPKELKGAGSYPLELRVKSGSRLILTFDVFSIDPGASVQLEVFNQFSENSNQILREKINSSQTGSFTRVIEDFHDLFSFNLTVSNGSAEVSIGLSIKESNSPSHDAILSEEGKTFNISTGAENSRSRAQSPYVLIRNPAGSKKILKLDQILFGAPNSGWVIYRIYATPTITAVGTLLTPVGARQNNQSSPVCEIRLNPSASNNGTEFMTVRIDANASPLAYQFNHSRLLEPGFDYLITREKSTRRSTIMLSMEYSEL